jgi:hypothetical protein
MATTKHKSLIFWTYLKQQQGRLIIQLQNNHSNTNRSNSNAFTAFNINHKVAVYVQHYHNTKNSNKQSQQQGLEMLHAPFRVWHLQQPSVFNIHGSSFKSSTHGQTLSTKTPGHEVSLLSSINQSTKQIINHEKNLGRVKFGMNSISSSNPEIDQKQKFQKQQSSMVISSAFNIYQGSKHGFS